MRAIKRDTKTREILIYRLFQELQILLTTLKVITYKSKIHSSWSWQMILNLIN